MTARTVDRQLAREVVELDRQDVDDIELALGRQALAQAGAEVAVDARDLQRAPVELLAQCIKRLVAQPREVAPQDQVDQPPALEHVDRPRVHIGPPVGLLEVLGNRGDRTG